MNQSIAWQLYKKFIWKSLLRVYWHNFCFIFQVPHHFHRSSLAGNLPLVSCLVGVSFWFDYISCKSRLPTFLLGVSILKFICPPRPASLSDVLLLLASGRMATLPSWLFTQVRRFLVRLSFNSTSIQQQDEKQPALYPAIPVPFPSSKSWFASWTSFPISTPIFCELHLFWLLQEICKS